MSFVIEQVKTPQLIAEFRSFALTVPFNGRPLDPWRWVVDRQRGWYFVSLGGGAAEMPSFLKLFNRDGLEVKIEGRRRSQGPLQPQSVEVWWTLERIEIPKQHAGRADELLQLIDEALQAYGSLGRSDVTKAVHVESIAPTFV